jgi:hypothetical protein
MLLCLEVGWRIGLRGKPPEAEGAATGVRVVEGAVFGLLGVLVAFTFSGAATRFDTRRQLIVEEINAIRRAYVRLTKSAEKPRRSGRGWIGVGRAGLNAQEPNNTHAVPEPLMGEGPA